MVDPLRFDTLPKDLTLAENFDVFLCNGYSLPSFAIAFLKNEANTFEAKEDDVYVVSYPKTGTTWLQELVYLVHSNVDLETAKKVDLSTRFPYIEHARTNYSYVQTMPSPRLLKTHLPFSLLPQDIHKKQCKMIYITRNPRDVAVSYYHFACMLKETQYKGTFEQFFQRFIRSRATYSPFLQHNLEFWNHREDKNVLFLSYEGLKTDLPANIKKISDFLDRHLTPEDINVIVQYCDFKNMSKQETAAKETDTSIDVKIGKFFRKGEIGDWKNYFTPDMIKSLDEKVEEVLKDSGLKYTYEI